MKTLPVLGFLILASSTAYPQGDLNFDDLFPRRSYFGKSASGLKWSFDDRYLAYLWNPYKERGNDLWLYDTKSGKSTRVTSITMMAQFDRDIPKAIERYKKDDEEDVKTDKMGDRDYREHMLKKREEDSKRREPLPSYPGISQIVWANKSHDYLLIYKGDIFRGKVGSDELIRMTNTRDSESSPRWSFDDAGFTYRRGDGVYFMRFDSPIVRQLNPPLPNNMSMGSYSISPDGTKLMVTSFRSIGPERQVDFITYRDRFAQAQKTSRGVAEDKFNQESYVFLYDLNDDPKTNPKHDGKPWEVWKNPGGEELWQSSISDEPWSPDSKRFVFATWKRDQKEFTVVVADPEKKESKVAFKATVDGEHTTPSLSDPTFTPDGSQIYLMMELSGYRHVWFVDPMKEGATQLTRGDFETYPIRMSKDGKWMYVVSAKESPARMNVYKVDVATGEYHRLSRLTGNYGTPEISNGGEFAAGSFSNWSTMSELYVYDARRGGGEKKITDSHREGFDKVNKLKPELFTYKNRHGHTVHGYLFLPPGFKKEDKRPLFIYVYGGPLGTGRSVVDGSFNSSAYLFNMYLAYVHGYVTVTIDPRGQSGYGSVFGKANWEAPGVAQVEDLSDGVKYLTDAYGVDSKKVGINGWSFGGFQTQMCLYTAPDVFTLGIAGAGPTEWQNYNTWYTGGVIGNARDGKPEDLDKYSLTHFAKNLRSPLMLLHGVEDTNVLYQDTVKVYRKLLQYGLGSLVELVIDPTGGHGLGGDINNRDRHMIYLNFILRHFGSAAKG